MSSIFIHQLLEKMLCIKQNIILWLSYCISSLVNEDVL